jgi:hypothetical protein
LDRGRIVVVIERDQTQGDLKGAGEATFAPIIGFTITDDGIGFTSKNFESFETIDSLSKHAIGGKGIGRLTWLAAFQRAAVSSTFREGGKTYRRTFEFEPSIEGVVNHSVTEVDSDSKVETTVRLLGFKRDYADRVPVQATAIGRRIIEHWLAHLTLGACPRIDLTDSQTNTTDDLRDVFRAEVMGESITSHFQVKGAPLSITHVKIKASGQLDHRLHFCAHQRTVTNPLIGDAVPNLTKSLQAGEEAPFVYYGFVSGDALDQAVSDDRTSFNFDTSDELLGDEALTEQDIFGESASQAGGFLKDYTAPLAEQKTERVQKYVYERAPRYRHVLKHRPDVLNAIPPSASFDRIDLELYKAQQRYQAELRSEYHRLLAEQDKDAITREKQEAEFRQFLEEWNEAGRDALAEHVMLRGATLTYLDSKREVIEGTHYVREDVVHDVICPMYHTSDDLPPEKMNLWIIDEGLAYHRYLGSEKSFTKQRQDGFAVEGGLERPDIIIFDHPMAFSEKSCQGVVLIEFKRPSRTDYPEDDNPFDQVERYVQKVRHGGETDNKGKPIAVAKNAPFHAYIMADLKPSLRALAERRGMTPHPDGKGFFSYNGNLKLWTELWSYDRMIDGARKRNATFFEKLGVNQP